MPANCLIIGLGQIGMGYDLFLDPAKAVYTHARAFSVCPSFELLGAVDFSAEKRELFTKHFNRPAFSDIKTAVRHTTPDIVVIASPTTLHTAQLKELLTLCAPKLILCEKPLAYQLNEAREITTLCDQNNVKLFVNYIRRSDPGVLEIKNRILTNKIAGDIKGVAWYSKGFLNNGSHLFNLLEFWLGRYLDATVIHKGRLWIGMDPEPDIEVRFERGVIIFLAAREENFSHYTIEMIASTGRLRYEQGGEYILWYGTQGANDIDGYTFLTAEPEIIPNRMQFYQLSVAENIAQELRGEQTPLCTGKEALITLESMHTIIKQTKL